MAQKLGVLIYHKDIYQIYDKRWVDKCIDSIMEQTVNGFNVYELCYSEDRLQLFSGFNYTHKPMPNHIHAMNYVLDQAFEDGCDIVMNVNLDDFYHASRFEKQIKAIKAGYDLVSSNFQHVEERDGADDLGQMFDFANLSIHEEFNKGHNVLCHPSIAYSRKFWETNKYYDVDRLGDEDFQLWKKALNNGSKIHIIPEVLCYYRQSPKQTGRIHKAQ